MCYNLCQLQNREKESLDEQIQKVRIQVIQGLTFCSCQILYKQNIKIAKTKQSMFYNTKKLSKYRRVKSQQMFQIPQSDGREEDPSKSIHNRKSGPSYSYLLQVVKPKSSKSIKIVIPAHLTIPEIKHMICEKLDIKNNSIYFFSFDFDYHFDFRFHQNIGKLDAHRKLGYRLIQEYRNDFCRKKINDYFIYDCLSVGGFSKVFLSRCKLTGQFYAAKFIDKHFQVSPKFQDLIYNQKYINEILDYPFLVKMHQFIETGQFYILILDYCPSGQLFSLMKSHRNMTEQEAKFYFLQTILAIQYMHSQSIIYRDIKPENILLDKFGHIRIADFGLAKILREKTNSYCGSLQYMAPEIVQGVEHSFGVDHYCLGSLLYQMMVGCPPFYNPNFNQIQTKYHIVNSSVKFPTNKQLSPQIIDFISKLLDKNPKTRLGSVSGIKQILSHPWIGKFDRQKYQKKEFEPPFKVSLEKSNFESTYLPKQEIERMKKKINKQLNEKDFDQQASNSKQNKKTYLSFHREKGDKQGSNFKRLKSTQDKGSASKNSSIDMKAYFKYLGRDKSDKEINPYQNILIKRDKKLSFSANVSSKSKSKVGSTVAESKDFKKVKRNGRSSKELGAILYLQEIRNNKLRASLEHFPRGSKQKSKDKEEKEGKHKWNQNMNNHNQVKKNKMLNKKQGKKNKQNIREKFSFKSEQLQKILREKNTKHSIENEEKVFQGKQCGNRLSNLFAESILR